MRALTASFLAMACASLSFAAAGTIKGRVTVGDGMTVPKGAVIFIAARPAAGGPPLAVKRVADAKFPLDFELGPENAMMAGGALSGELEITVRASQTGDAMARTPGDLFGTVKAKAGATGVAVRLDRRI